MSALAETATAPLAIPSTCLHCGDPCPEAAVRSAHGIFCCAGCESVFDILQASGLQTFYQLDDAAGVSQKDAAARAADRFAALDDQSVAARLVHFDTGEVARATLSIPAIHCASCVWLLEQLWRFDPGVVRAEVDLLRRAVHVEFRKDVTSLRTIAEHLARLGYEPAVTAEDRRAALSPQARRLYLQIGIAGFAFGNIMLFSIPRYANGAPLEPAFQRLFDVLNVLFAVPVLLYSASDYFRIAWHAVRSRTMALEIPVAIGLVVLFGRSVFDIAMSRSEGFIDSFAGLVFFLLIGRLFQQKVFDRVAFDRTFRSFLPLSVLVDRGDGMRAVPIQQLEPGDQILVRPHEVVPADAMLLEDLGEIDYAFVTGEQTPVPVRFGQTVRAGGRIAGRALRLRVLREVSDSQLASFWSNQVFSTEKRHVLTDIASRFGAWFTVGALALAAAGAYAWWPDASAAFSVATAVLIIACPCALTIAAPLTLGTAMGMLGRCGLYLKQPAVALDLSRIDAVAFDKTGTLTTHGAAPVIEHAGLTQTALALVQRLAAESVHPTSRAIAAALPAPLAPASAPRFVVQRPGLGVRGVVDGHRVVLGHRTFVAAETGLAMDGPEDATFVVAGGEQGWVRTTGAARPGVEHAAAALAGAHQLSLLSGDHDGEGSRWRSVFGARMLFRQSPQDKLAFVHGLQAQGRRVLMVGDGLNDAGALAAADVGLAVSDETACITPACDAVISGAHLAQLPAFLRYCRRARHVVVTCFVVSVFYNVLGIGMALAGLLTPLATAILMPVSSLTIVAISTGSMRWAARGMLGR